MSDQVVSVSDHAKSVFFNEPVIPSQSVRYLSASAGICCKSTHGVRMTGIHTSMIVPDRPWPSPPDFSQGHAYNKNCQLQRPSFPLLMLAGYSEMLSEKQRLRDSKIEPDESDLELLNPN